MRQDQNKFLEEPWLGRLDELDHFSESDFIFGRINETAATSNYEFDCERWTFERQGKQEIV